MEEVDLQPLVVDSSYLDAVQFSQLLRAYSELVFGDGERR